MDDSSTEVNSQIFYNGGDYEDSVVSEFSFPSPDMVALRDPKSHILKRKIDGKNKRIHVFPTPEHLNAHMINAVTGIAYYNDDNGPRYTLGTCQEDDVFKVKFLTGEAGAPPLLLCYDTPEQYEKHLRGAVKTSIKETWHTKNQKYRREMLSH